MENQKVRIRRAVLAVWCLCGAMLGVSGQQIEAACLPQPAGLIGWWQGEAGAGDARGLFPGSLQGGVTFVPGKVGQAFQFNGTNTWVEVPDASELSPHTGASGELTLEAWVYLPRLPKWDAPTGQANRAIAIKGSPGNWEYGFYVTTNLIPVFGTWQANGSGYSSAFPTNAISTNEWHHLVGVLRKGQFARIYVDGVLGGESTSFSGDTSNGTSPLYIGRRGDGQWLDGLVDEVSVYGRALGSLEVSALYGAGTDGKCPGFAGASVPYFTDFESGLGTEWSLPSLNADEQAVFTKFSGRFNNTPQTLTLTNLVVGQTYRLGFDLYTFDSWDGNGQSDTVSVRINGSTPWQYTFSNYNQEPPNSAQSFPGSPDQGRAGLGFVTAYVDAIYRNVEVLFTASNSTALISFCGVNVDGNVDDESWGLDNVGVGLASSVTNTFVRSSTLPAAGSVSSISLSYFTISANWPLSLSTATNVANYSLTTPGSDGVFGTADDLMIPFTVVRPGGGGRSVQFTLAQAPLQPGSYRFQTLAGLQGTNGVAVSSFVRDFTIANPMIGAIESPSNDSIPEATSLPVVETPVGSGFSTAFGIGEFSITSDVDYWRFDAEAGDVLTIRIECEARGVYPYLYVQNASGGNVFTTSGGVEGVAQLQNVTITTPGTYYVRVWSNNNRSRYWLRFDQARGLQTETEDNGSTGAANQVNLAYSAGLSQGRIAGSLPMADGAGDYFRLGTLNVGNSINVTVQYPTGSTLAGRPPVLTVWMEGQALPLASTTSGNLNHTVTADGVYHVRASAPAPVGRSLTSFESASLALRAQYILNFTLGDGVTPLITSATLPGEGSTTTDIVDRFSLTFSEDLERSSVSNNVSYELRCAGADNVFFSADDQLYAVRTTGYTVGLSSGYAIIDGPLQSGSYRFTVRTNIMDRAGNNMSAPYVRSFAIAKLAGYVLEGRNNDTSGAATHVAPVVGTNGNGSVGWINNVGTGSNPRYAAPAFLNGDTNLDLLVANFSSDSMTSLTNDGRGGLVAAANIPTGDGSISVVAGDIDGDGKADAVLANYYASTVSVLVGDGTGQFVSVTNIGGFSNPYNMAMSDVNGDGKLDLIVPSYGGSYLSVLLGNGDGTFQARTNYPTGTSPQSVAVGDLNGDGRPDLVTANYASSTLSIFTNGGSGRFTLSTNLPCGPNPRFVAIADVDADGKSDIVVLQTGDSTVGVFLGNGDGTFKAKCSYHTGGSDQYNLVLSDMNGDQKVDIIVSGYGNNTFCIILNNGSGVFTNLHVYGASSNPIGATTGRVGPAGADVCAEGSDPSHRTSPNGMGQYEFAW